MRWSTCYLVSETDNYMGSTSVHEVHLSQASADYAAAQYQAWVDAANDVLDANAPYDYRASVAAHMLHQRERHRIQLLLKPLGLNLYSTYGVDRADLILET